LGINKGPRNPRAFVLLGAKVIVEVHRYLERIQHMLLDKRNENAEVDISGPRWLPSKDGRELVTLRATVRFATGHVLEVSENFLIAPSGNEWSRKFSYYFGRPDSDEERIFLFDNHGVFGAAAHLDLGDDERLSGGDPRLNGFEPGNVDVTELFEYLDLYFDGQPFPWNAQ
jgi:hypothetical protein